MIVVLDLKKASISTVIKSVLLFVLFNLTSFNFEAVSEEVKECVRGQYLMSASVPALRTKAEEALEEVSNDEFYAIDQSKDRKIVLLEENAGQTSSAHIDEDDVEVLTEDDDLCIKLRKQRRAKLLNAQETGRAEIAAKRIFTCGCNQFYRTEAVTPNDPYMSQLWGMSQASDIDIDADDAWIMTTGSSSQVVAVIDTGVDYNHPDLQQNMWVNPNEIAGNGLDDDGNGYIDDVHGINAINGSGNPMDDHGHGTHCAGTISGRGNNGVGVVGVTWNTKIMAVKFLGSGGGSSMDAVESIQYVTNMKRRGVNIRLSNNSWGGSGYDPFIYNAIQDSRNEGLLFVAAAGNSGLNIDTNSFLPAGYNLDNIISVAAINNSGNLTSWSNYGAANVDVAAPGNGIVSTYLSWSGSYYTMSGTSMAAPHVSGALALLVAYNPSLSWTALRNNLFDNGVSLGSLTGRVKTGKLINVNNMLLNAYAPGQTPIPTSTPTNTPTPMPTNTPTIAPTATATFTPTATPTPGYYGLTGYVRKDSDGSGVGGARVTLRYNSNVFTSYTDSSGRYSFSNILGPITYSVDVVSSGYSITSSSIYLNTNRTLDFAALQNAYVLSGRVIDTDKNPVAGISITLNRSDNNSFTTDSQGYFAFSVPLGMQYSLRASSGDAVFNLNDLSGTVYGDVQRVFVVK
jgi:subtilisin family serine protease